MGRKEESRRKKKKIQLTRRVRVRRLLKFSYYTTRSFKFFRMYGKGSSMGRWRVRHKLRCHEKLTTLFTLS